jgi:hypothetical protein
MSIRFHSAAAAVAALAVLALPGAAAAQSWTDWGEAEARQLIEAENGVVTEITHGPGAEMTLLATIDDWLIVSLIGQDCEGDGAKQRCKSLGFSALFEVDDPARAATLEDSLNFQYVADLAMEGDIVIHRQVELIGGAPLANIRAQLNGFVIVSEHVTAEIWPEKGAAAEPAAPAKGAR